MTILISILAFILAVGVIVTVHEFGHYWVAKMLGVKVLRFSIGFGKPLWLKRAGRDKTEYVLAMIPLGGYVKMLDEREVEVSEDEAPRAFNRQPLKSRFAIVAAGPAFNFIFAIFAYWLMFIVGVTGVRPIVGDVTPDSIASEAGLQYQDEIVAVDQREHRTWESVSIAIFQSMLETDTVDMKVIRNDVPTYVHLKIDDTKEFLGEGALLGKLGIGIWRPRIEPVIGEVFEDSPASRAGMKPGDQLRSVDGQKISAWNEWVKYVRSKPDQTLHVVVLRNGSVTRLRIHTSKQIRDGKTIGKIGASPHIDPNLYQSMRINIRYSPEIAFIKGVVKTWHISLLTLRVLWKLVTGQASLKNIAGPITIAEYAGVSAVIGLSAFLSMLAIFSISIGILNLLPIPILDGGYLFYYVIEWFKGSPVSEHTELVGQKIGLIMLIALMTLAFYNDFTRLLGQ